MKNLLVILVLLSIRICAQTHVEPDKIKAFNITVNYDNYTVKTQMLKSPKKINTKPDLTYHWYSSQKIIETKGGFDGKLLHGYYKSFYLSNQLFESGEFKYGLKNNEWKNWYSDGKLKEITHWKNGKKNGKYFLFNDDGTKVASGNFKNDQLSGKFNTYDKNGNIILSQSYKNGVIQVKTPKLKKEKSTKPKEETIKPEKKERKSIFKKKEKKVESGEQAPKEKKKGVCLNEKIRLNLQLQLLNKKQLKHNV